MSPRPLLPLLALLFLTACGDKAEDTGVSDTDTDSGSDTDTDTGGEDDTDEPSLPDRDGDGYGDAAAGGDDCDDAHSGVYPGADEVCDGYDNDCDGVIDPDDSIDAPTWHADADADGYPSAEATVVTCEQPAGYLPEPSKEILYDCDDSDAAFHPFADEDDCTDPNDYDCDGSVSWADEDSDGWAACVDCDDTDAYVNPDATEICDELDVDEDCSGAADDADPDVDTTTQTRVYDDSDEDGYGDMDDSGKLYCDPPSDMVEDNTDCDDWWDEVNPGQSEICDEWDTDEDCSGDADDEDSGVDTSTYTTWYTDADGDGYGDLDDAGTTQCDAPDDTVDDNTDCDDAEALSYPGATELCDGLQNDCDDTSWTDDAGLASLYDSSDASWSDETSTLSTGSDGAPLSSTLADGDSLQVCEGTWYVSLTLAGSGEVRGVGDVDAVILDGGGTDRVISATSSGDEVLLENLTIRNGYQETSTAGVRASKLDLLELDTVVIADCEGYYGGGGSFSDMAAMTWTDVTFSGNSTHGNHAGGAVVNDITSFTAVDVSFEDNESAAYAGGLLTNGSTSATFENLVMEGNVADHYGGAWYLTGAGSYTVTDCELSENTAGYGGGAIEQEGSLSLEDCTLSGNGGKYGGAIEVTGTGSTLTADTVTFESNEVSGNGAAIFFASDSIGDLTDSDFIDNVDGAGAIYVESGASLTVDSGDFSGNDPADVYSGEAYTYGTGESFTCDGDSCR